MPFYCPHPQINHIPPTYHLRINSDHGRSWYGDGTYLIRSSLGVGPFETLVYSNLQNTILAPVFRTIQKPHKHHNIKRLMGK